MPVQKAFQIVSHFKFEVGAAIVGANKMETHLDRISRQAKGINEQFKVMFVSAALNVSGGQAGFVGVLKNAVSASEDFYNSQRKLSTVIAGNAKNFTQPIDSFNKAMKISKSILSDMVEEANRFGIRTNSFVETFNNINPLLVPKGAAGTNFENSRKLSRNLMMGSTILGMTPGEAQWQMQTLIQGTLGNPNQTLFNRLKQETEAFRGMTPGKFNQLKAPQRIERLNRAFDQFLQKPGVLEAHLNSLTTQMTILNNQFGSMGSRLKPLGDVIRGPLIKSLMELNKWLGGEFAKSVKMISSSIKPMVSDLQELYISLDKLGSLGSTASLAKQFSLLAFAFVELARYIPWVSKQLLKVGIIAGSGIVASIGQLLKWLTRTNSTIKALGKTFLFFFTSIAAYLRFLVPLFAVFRVIDTAKAQARVKDFKRFGESTSLLTQKMLELKDVVVTMVAPFSYMINTVASSISYLFEKSYWLEKLHALVQNLKLNEFFENLSGGFVMTFSYIEAGLATMSRMAMEFFNTLNPKGNQFLNFAQMGRNLEKIFVEHEAFQEANWERHYKSYNKFLEKRLEDSRKPENVVNIGKVEIRNQFKENLEPDRIAVSIKESLLKSAQAPIDTISRDQVFSPGLGSI